MSSFTAHNVKLPNGNTTFPEAGFFIADSPWLHAALRVLKLKYANDLQGKSIVDLGCLEGGYALEFAKRGMLTTGIEVRESNLENCQLVADAFQLPNLKFVRADVWDVADHGPFNVAFCCGLLYHLDAPRAFVRKLGACVSDVVLLNTHYAVPEDDGTPNLSSMTEHEGLPGRWYLEHDLDASQVDELEKIKWTSWSNKRSFWPTRPALLQSLKDAGFDLVFEQADWVGDDLLGGLTTGFAGASRRGMFVGIRT